MAIKLKDIAKHAGVSVGTACSILGRREGRYAEQTRKAVYKAAKELGYHPSAAARALVTRRTGHIGFLLSDTIADGLGNAFFSQMVCGVERACRQTGYGLNISLYNLSNIDTFILPPKVGQRSVDGLVLCGYVEAAVVRRFQEFGIPCVCIGDNVEVAGMIPTIACDFVDGLYQAVTYAAGLGHRQIAFCNESTRRGREVGKLLIERAAATPETANCRIQMVEFPGGLLNYDDGRPLMEYWLSRPQTSRPSVILCSDQTALSFLFEISRKGFQCPRDVGLICEGDSRMSMFATPPLTSIHYDVEAYGVMAVEMLVKHLDHNKPLTGSMSRIEPCRLIVRRSVGPAGKL
jgi:LacI family transcriptional regulator